jgi:hypothetical protein
VAIFKNVVSSQRYAAPSLSFKAAKRDGILTSVTAHANPAGFCTLFWTARSFESRS